MLEGIAVGNPFGLRRGGFRSVKNAKKSQADKRLSRQELQALLDATRKEPVPFNRINAYSLFALAGNFGLRCSEALDLNRSDFRSLPVGYFRVRTLKKKATVEDRIYVGKEGKKLCERILESQKAVSRGDPLFTFTDRTARYLFAYFADIAGISTNVSFHSLRHCAAHMIWNATKDARIVNALLRHKPMTTEVYMYPSDEEMVEAIEKMGVVS